MMAEIRPFRGYRFALKSPDDLKRYVAPPYDMLSASMIDDLYNADDHNVVRITQCKAQSDDTTNKDRHRRAARTLSEWINEHVLIRDDQSSVYVCKQTFIFHDGAAERTAERTGVIVLVKLVDFSEKVVLPHEATLSGPKQDRYDLLEVTRSHTEQIFGLLEDTGDFHHQLRDMSAGEPDGIFEDATGVVHRLYHCGDQKFIVKLIELAAGKTILIADGHHRYETALNFYRDTKNCAYDSIMMTLVSTADPGLVIRPFHRLIRREGNRVVMREALSDYFTLTDLGDTAPEPVYDFILSGDKRGEFVFQDSETGRLFSCSLNEEGKRFVASIMPEHSMEWKLLPVSLINILVINTILGLPLDGKVLHDVVDYVNDAGIGTERCSDGEKWYGGFYIRPLSIGTIGSIVSAGERMPQKSTNFYPKMYSGLVLHSMDRR
jgi:uncharacterized protein (DUF1015 family)